MKSIDNFNMALTLFENKSEESGVVKCLLGIGNAYGLRNEKEKSSECYHQALIRYNLGKKEGKIKVEPKINSSQYKNMGN